MPESEAFCYRVGEICGLERSCSIVGIAFSQNILQQRVSGSQIYFVSLVFFLLHKGEISSGESIGGARREA